MSEDIVIENVISFCLHDKGQCVCPMCGKPCDWEFYSLMREAIERGKDQEKEA